MEPENIFTAIPTAAPEKIFTELLHGDDFRLERIVSTGQATPEGEWYDQDHDEWVLLIAGAARLRFDDGCQYDLRLGDYVNIPAHRRHRVAWTEQAPPTVWLALHYRAANGKQTVQ